MRPPILAPAPELQKSLTLAWLAIASCLPVIACTASPSEPSGSAAATDEAPDREGPQIRFAEAGSGEVAALARQFAEEARADGREPLVYVGATWCEPCRYFHAAAERGELDDQLPRLALLEFDRDRDGERLDAAGYGSTMIPLFVVPGRDGRGTGQRIEGSIHGPTSPTEIAPRLRLMLAR